MKEAIKQADRYIIDEAPAILAEQPEILRKVFSAFPAFKSLNYRLYFTGQAISLTGTWMQIVGTSWLTLQLSHNSAFMIGVIGALSTLPTLIFSLYAGVLVDKYEKKKVFYVSQILALVFSLILGVLTVTHIITIPSLAVLVLILGTIDAFYGPARLAFVNELVGRTSLSSAVAINAGLFNATRIIGPAIAGFMISVIGVGWTFIFNAVSYIAVLIALRYIRVKEEVHAVHPDPVKAIREGVNYTRRHPIISTMVIFSGVLAIFGWSYTTLLPLIIQNIYHMGPSGLGIFYTSAGLGALLGSFIMSLYAQKIKPALFIMAGNICFGLAIITFSFAPPLYGAMAALFVAGFGLICQFATFNATIQHMVEPRYRGRVLSIYTLMFLGMAPIGNLEIGLIAEHWGPMMAIRINAVVVILFGLIIATQRHAIRKAYDKYQARAS